MSLHTELLVAEAELRAAEDMYLDAKQTVEALRAKIAALEATNTCLYCDHNFNPKLSTATDFSNLCSLKCEVDKRRADRIFSYEARQAKLQQLHRDAIARAKLHGAHYTDQGEWLCQCQAQFLYFAAFIEHVPLCPGPVDRVTRRLNGRTALRALATPRSRIVTTPSLSEDELG